MSTTTYPGAATATAPPSSVSSLTSGAVSGNDVKAEARKEARSELIEELRGASAELDRTTTDPTEAAGANMIAQILANLSLKD